MEKYQEIDKVFYWLAYSGENIVEFMEETLRISNRFVNFCSENAVRSSSVEYEWQAAYQLNKSRSTKYQNFL